MQCQSAGCQGFFLGCRKKTQDREWQCIKGCVGGGGKKLASDTHLDGRECDSLINVGNSLGYLDLAQHISNLEFYLESVDEDITVLSEKYSDNCRMYMSLGVMAGLFLTIILI